MTIQVVTLSGSSQALSNSVRTQYIENYFEGAMSERIYDQIAAPIGQNMSQLKRGSSVQVEFLSDMPIATSAISEVTDLTPVALRDATASITPTSRANSMQASEKLMNTVFTDYMAKFSKRVGANMMESVDKVAQDAAVKGSFVLRAAVRGSIDAGTTGHRASETDFLEASGYLQSFRIPGFVDRVNGNPAYPAIMHPYVFHDILSEASGNILAVAQYQNSAIYFNHELAQIHEFRFVVSPFAKVLYGAGAANTKSVDTVLASELTALSTTLVISNTSSVENGAWLNIGTTDTGSTHQYNAERVKYSSAAHATITFIGEGSSGGARWDHVAGTKINNSDSVYTVVIGGSDSLAKVYDTEVGEFGEIVGPKKSGQVDQWESLGWKWYGGYGRLRENGLVRMEVSVSNEA